MRTTAMLFLLLALGCGDDDSVDSGRDAATDAPSSSDVTETDAAETDAAETDAAMDVSSSANFLEALRDTWLTQCDCAADPDGCRDDAEKVALQVTEQGDCVVTPFSDPSAEEFVGCLEGLTSDLSICLAASTCDEASTSACYEAYDGAIESCPQPADSVWEAVDACFD